MHHPTLNHICLYFVTCNFYTHTHIYIYMYISKYIYIYVYLSNLSILTLKTTSICSSLEASLRHHDLPTYPFPDVPLSVSTIFSLNQALIIRPYIVFKQRGNHPQATGVQRCADYFFANLAGFQAHVATFAEIQS